MDTTAYTTDPSDSTKVILVIILNSSSISCLLITDHHGTILTLKSQFTYMTSFKFRHLKHTLTRHNCLEQLHNTLLSLLSQTWPLYLSDWILWWEQVGWSGIYSTPTHHCPDILWPLVADCVEPDSFCVEHFSEHIIYAPCTKSWIFGIQWPFFNYLKTVK